MDPALRDDRVMTVAPSHSQPFNAQPFNAQPSKVQPSVPAADVAPLLDLPGERGEELLHRLRLVAATKGMTVSALVEQWLREGLERFESQQPIEDPDGSGRCSLRTGTCSLGPVPLPVQQ